MLRQSNGLRQSADSCVGCRRVGSTPTTSRPGECIERCRSSSGNESPTQSRRTASANSSRSVNPLTATLWSVLWAGRVAPPHRIACDGPSEVWVGDPTHRVAAELSALVRTRRRHLQLIRENEPTPPAPDARIELPGGDSMSPQPTSRRAMTAAISASRVISGERRCLRTDQRRPRLPATRPSRRGVRNPRRARTAADTLVARRVSGFACSASMPTRHAVGDSPPRLRFARFPFRTTIDKFDFAFQPTVDRPFVDDLATLWFMEAGRPILFLASPAAASRTSLSRSPRSRARPGSAATHQRRREVGGEAQPPELGSSPRPRISLITDRNFSLIADNPYE